MMLRHGWLSGAVPSASLDFETKSNTLINIDICKNRNKSSVTNKKQTRAEYFIDKKAINKNL
ncbi:TPA: hypothetical protein MHW50_01720 [Klebsiella pneumoniae]|nr:hypothetical protein DJ500_03025 [Klebsiella pneumoniae]TYE21196.1 hypothetical protein DJ510_06580 [Klebsiella pneumoniae]HBX3301483.1 hypothetical protein [Klebsiella pneumoniae]HBX3307132.1 hypothetical protein [Klebsiella pneumoniae]HBX3345150.1 hypothetical protein [Klebsiella pneumoniae]